MAWLVVQRCVPEQSAQVSQALCFQDHSGVHLPHREGGSSVHTPETCGLTFREHTTICLAYNVPQIQASHHK